MSKSTARAAGTITIGDLTVNRMGYGAMRLTGEGIWGEPRDPAEARRVLRRAVELDVNFIDTADSYGPEVSERLIAEALRPYPDDLVIATKGGLCGMGPISGGRMAGPATCGRRSRGASGGSGWSGSTSTSSTGRTRRFPTRSRWASWCA
jgi:hypothetical protein